MVKGSRDAQLRKIQPLSIHGQISWNIYFVDPDNPDQVHVARVGPEAVDQDLNPGDRIRLEYVLGAVTSVKKLPA
jgi:hypothetical protein